jgi:hypothetical protein
MICRIFTIAPGARKMFKKFIDVPSEDLPENEHFCSHALQVTETISLAVSSLDDIEGLIGVLKDLGAAHSSHGLNDEYFDVSLYFHDTCNMQRPKDQCAHVYSITSK